MNQISQQKSYDPKAKAEPAQTPRVAVKPDQAAQPALDLKPFQSSRHSEPAGRSEPRTQPEQQTPKATPETQATQRDLIELHKRFVAMFSTLNQGLAHTATTKAAEDRAALIERLDDVEQAINSMEGMLRIEMTPQIRTVVREEISAKRSITPSIFGRFFWLGALLSAAIFIGVTFEQEIRFVTDTLISKISSPQ